MRAPAGHRQPRRCFSPCGAMPQFTSPSSPLRARWSPTSEKRGPRDTGDLGAAGLAEWALAGAWSVPGFVDVSIWPTSGVSPAHYTGLNSTLSTWRSSSHFPYLVPHPKTQGPSVPQTPQPRGGHAQQPEDARRPPCPLTLPSYSRSGGAAGRAACRWWLPHF